MSAEDQVATLLRQGWAVKAQLPDRYIMVAKTKKPLQFPRWVHLILILCTGGLWTLVWIWDEMGANTTATREIMI